MTGTRRVATVLLISKEELFLREAVSGASSLRRKLLLTIKGNAFTMQKDMIFNFLSFFEVAHAC